MPGAMAAKRWRRWLERVDRSVVEAGSEMVQVGFDRLTGEDERQQSEKKAELRRNEQKIKNK